MLFQCNRCKANDISILQKKNSYRSLNISLQQKKVKLTRAAIWQHSLPELVLAHLTGKIMSVTLPWRSLCLWPCPDGHYEGMASYEKNFSHTYLCSFRNIYNKSEATVEIIYFWTLNHTQGLTLGNSVLQERLCYDMIMIQVWKSFGQWLLRYVCF